MDTPPSLFSETPNAEKLPSAFQRNPFPGFPRQPLGRPSPLTEHCAQRPDIARTRPLLTESLAAPVSLLCRPIAPGWVNGGVPTIFGMLDHSGNPQPKLLFASACFCWGSLWLRVNYQTPLISQASATRVLPHSRHPFPISAGTTRAASILHATATTSCLYEEGHGG